MQTKFWQNLKSQSLINNLKNLFNNTKLNNKQQW